MANSITIKGIEIVTGLATGAQISVSEDMFTQLLVFDKIADALERLRLK